MQSGHDAGRNDTPPRRQQPGASSSPHSIACPATGHGVAQKRVTLDAWHNRATTHQRRPARLRAPTSSSLPTGPWRHVHKHATPLACRTHTATHQLNRDRRAPAAPPALPLSTRPNGPGATHKSVAPIVRHTRMTHYQPRQHACTTTSTIGGSNSSPPPLRLPSRKAMALRTLVQCRSLNTPHSNVPMQMTATTAIEGTSTTPDHHCLAGSKTWGPHARTQPRSCNLRARAASSPDHMRAPPPQPPPRVGSHQQPPTTTVDQDKRP